MEELIKEILEKGAAFGLNAQYSLEVGNEVTQSYARNMAGELIDLLHEYICMVDDDEPDLTEEPLIRFQKPDEGILRR